MKRTRYEHHLDLVTNDGFEQPREGGQRADIFPGKYGREFKVGAGCELSEALLGTVDLGPADQELLAQVGVGPGEFDFLVALVGTTVTTERIAEVVGGLASWYPSL